MPQACFVHDFSALLGIEEDPTLLECARARAFELDRNTYARVCPRSGPGADNSPPPRSRHTLGFGHTPIEFARGNFRSIDWSNAGVTLVDALGWPEADVQALAVLAARLNPGAVLITLDQPCFSDCLTCTRCDGAGVADEEAGQAGTSCGRFARRAAAC